MRVLCIVVCVLLVCGGCLPNLFGGGPSLNAGGSPTEVLQNTIVKTDVLLSLFMLAVVAGVIVGLANFKMGWLVAAGNLLGIILHLTIVRYSQWFALLGLVSALAVVVAMVLHIRNFKWQNVKAIQTIRDKHPELKQEMTEILQSEQNEAVQNEVRQIKAKLGG